jgi:hypothetical protein
MTNTAPENPPFEIVPDNRLHAAWEKSEALALSIYTTNDGWIERRPTTASQTLRKMAEGFLEIASELDVLASEVAAEDERVAKSTVALSRAYAEVIGTIERDQLTRRFGEIVRTPYKPSEPTP